MQVARIYGKGSFESRSQAASSQAAVVCPKTCDTVAEDACNIASHLLIERTHDKRGIFRQSRSSHVRELPGLFKCEVGSPSFLLSKGFLDASCRAQPRAVCKYIWERLV